MLHLIKEEMPRQQLEPEELQEQTVDKSNSYYVSINFKSCAYIFFVLLASQIYAVTVCMALDTCGAKMNNNILYSKSYVDYNK